jgi:hypothetical protein
MEIDADIAPGAANFSASGLKRQDNDLFVIRDVQVAAKFKHAFATRFASGITVPATAAVECGSNFCP